MAVLIFLFTLAGCERAHRYPLPTSAASDKSLATIGDNKSSIMPQYGWLETYPRPDTPIQFIAEDAHPKEWQTLKDFWTGWPAALFQLSPLETVVTVRAQLYLDSIKIKVPRGLPDPTPLIPAVNPPTLGKWMLGKRLFYDDKLLKLSMTETASCASCHAPAQAFTVEARTTVGGSKNVPSLLNCVYNRHQYWDGRAVALEEVLLRNLEDERDMTQNPPPDKSPAQLHVWPGLVDSVRLNPDYADAFERVFGRKMATADSIAKALATYLRTLLSGNSLVDRAHEEMKKRGGKTLEIRDFEALLSGDALKLFAGGLTAKEVAGELSHGHDLFQGQARCYECHGGPLYTDHGFHNVGVGDSSYYPETGKEPGRFAVVPYGLKAATLIGAYKTPSLRNVSLTAPYMHDGSLATLDDVLQYFNDGIKPNEFLSPKLNETPYVPRKLMLDGRDRTAVELYLRALRGDELPAFVISPPPK